MLESSTCIATQAGTKPDVETGGAHTPFVLALTP